MFDLMRRVSMTTQPYFNAESFHSHRQSIYQILRDRSDDPQHSLEFCADLRSLIEEGMSR
jgi:hypothetical protein